MLKKRLFIPLLLFPAMMSAQTIVPDDIVFSELMVKPSPAVALPENEYVELYNRTGKAINLSGFKLADNSKKYTIGSCTIQPEGYLLLCAESKVNDYLTFGNCKGMSSFPALTDGGKLLWLEDSKGNVVSWVEYSSKWYGSSFKSGGGWSLECIDLQNTSNSANNWRASEDKKGGTPAAANSIAGNNPDMTNPRITGVAFISEKSIELFFDKPMDATNLSDKNNYKTELGISNMEVRYPKARSVVVHLQQAIMRGNIYEIDLFNITDKSNHLLENDEAKFALPEEMEPQDIVINELLFNALANAEKYVELYNRSDKALDLSNLILTNRRNDELSAGSALASARMLLFPKDYVLITSNITAICQYYQCDENATKIELSSMPSYPIAGGTVVLVARNGEIIDEFSYSEKMHHAMIKERKGVSLERINPHSPTQEADNWHSASFTCGYGTPGYKNSQFINESELPATTVSLEPETFSPDNNGINDVLNIRYLLSENGYTATIIIYDSEGRCVRKLVNNALLNTEGAFRWNGENDKGSICNIGIYIVSVELVNINGKTKSYKLPCVLSGKN